MSETVHRLISPRPAWGRWSRILVTPFTWIVLAFCSVTGGLWPHLRPDSYATGRAHRAPLSPVVTTSPPPLHKPEVSMLLAEAGRLGLRPEQQTLLRELDRRWQQERTEWQQHLEQAIRDTGHLLQGERARSGVALPAMMAGLRDYSRLSQAYDRRRAFWWERGLETLRPEQRRMALRSVLPGVSGGK
ncbi:MAG: hypothetical protein RMJ43_06355 [Chloroherpetonaceae bacterium]|nr:hypothetical protein [Chthonomonadaceae bacterium]MDW8207440.1 hypothetical protein [Chloroherpetonaceae bacterium]